MNPSPSPFPPVFAKFSYSHFAVSSVTALLTHSCFPLFLEWSTYTSSIFPWDQILACRQYCSSFPYNNRLSPELSSLGFSSLVSYSLLISLFIYFHHCQYTNVSLWIYAIWNSLFALLCLISSCFY